MEQSDPEFRAVFADEARRLGLGRMRYKPYSLRRGGATEDFRRHGQMDRALMRGRWKGVTAAKQYILEGVEMYVRLTRTPREEIGILRKGRVMKSRLKAGG